MLDGEQRFDSTANAVPEPAVCLGKETMPPHDSELRPREWKRWLDRCRQMSEDWARLLSHDLPRASQARCSEVAAEFEAFALQRVRLRFRRKGILLPGAAVLPGAPRFRSALAGSSAAAPELLVPRDGVSQPTRLPAPRPASASSAIPRTGRTRHAVTEAMLARFRRLTGFEGRDVSGSPESQADFLLSVIVFSLLTEGADVPDWQMTQLLKRIRWCREQLVAHVTSLDGSSRACPRNRQGGHVSAMDERRGLR